MQFDQASRTLLRPAIHKAAHQILDRPIIHHDPVSVGLVPDSTAAALMERKAELTTPAATLLRSVFVFRSLFAEDRLASAVAKGVTQYVIHGAGLDTFAWRQPEWARQLRIFALDHPASAAEVRRILQKRGLTQPANLTLVDCDLEISGVRAALTASGFDAGRPAFHSMLGLSQYLTPDAVRETLKGIAGFGSGTHLVMSFAPPQDDLEGDDFQEAANAISRSVALGEPWLFRPSVSALQQLLSDVGFTTVRYITPETAQVEHFAGRTDGLRAARLEQVMEATV